MFLTLLLLFRVSEGPRPSVLQEVSVPVINNSVCETMYHAAGYIEHIPNIFICAGWRKGGFDSCEVRTTRPESIRRRQSMPSLGLMATI